MLSDTIFLLFISAFSSGVLLLKELLSKKREVNGGTKTRGRVGGLQLISQFNFFILLELNDPSFIHKYLGPPPARPPPPSLPLKCTQDKSFRRPCFQSDVYLELVFKFQVVYIVILLYDICTIC